MVLGNMPNIASLRALIHVLPAYSHLYDTNREQIFTDVTLRMLKEEGLDILHLGTWVHLCIPKVGPSSLDLKSIFESCDRQVRAGERVKLSFKQCTDLLSINDSNQIWNTEGEEPDYKFWNVECGYRMACSDDERCQGGLRQTCKHGSNSFCRRYYARLPSLDPRLLCHDGEDEEYRVRRVHSHTNDDKNLHVTFLKGEEWLNMKTLPERNIFRLYFEGDRRS